jgi:hypothetical protein
MPLSYPIGYSLFVLDIGLNPSSKNRIRNDEIISN